MNLQFHIAADDEDPIARFLADSAKTNDLLTLEGPSGAFVLNENSANSLVFITEGIGFATVKGLIEHAMALDVAEDIFLFWIADETLNQYLGNLCRAWNDALDNFTYVAIDADDREHVADVLSKKLNSKNATQLDFYLCGRERLKNQFKAFAEQHSVGEQQLLYANI